jgi:hypothetical protein
VIAGQPKALADGRDEKALHVDVLGQSIRSIGSQRWTQVVYVT